MTADPVLAAPGTRIGDLARMMIDAHIHRIIVADPVTQRPLGIVSTMDVLAALARVEQMQDATINETVHDFPLGAVR
jgi:CBS domain-containing protein